MKPYLVYMVTPSKITGTGSVGKAVALEQKSRRQRRAERRKAMNKPVGAEEK